MGEPPLTDAVRKEEKSLVELIIAMSKELPRPDGIENILKWTNMRDETPLFVAVELGFPDIVASLVRNGANAAEPCIRGSY